MKKVYWRPRSVSRTALVLIALLSLAGVVLVEQFPIIAQRPHFEKKMDAAKLAALAMEEIYYVRDGLKEEHPEYAIDPVNDPALSGLIGLPMSPVTSVSGSLSAKQTSANPNFAAVVVDLLHQAGVQEGDTVAVGCSGSFPALNICVYAALETLKAKPIVICSASASQWGANVPELLWIDMERILRTEGFLSTKTEAASIGGWEDTGERLPAEGLQMIKERIRFNGIPLIETMDFVEGIDERVRIYRREAKGDPVKAYVNVGGGSISVGTFKGKKLFKPGLNLRPPKHVETIDSVMRRFIIEGVPVIHLVQINDLAERYGLPIAPTAKPNVPASTSEMPDCKVYVGTYYNKWLAGGVLAVVLASLYGFIRSDVGFRILRVSSRRRDHGHPEPMV